MRTCLVSVAIVAALAGSGLAETSQSLRQSVIDALMAEQIAIDCSSLRQDRKANRALDKRLLQARRAQKLNEDRLYSEYLGLTERDVITYGEAFLVRHDVDVDSEASWCALGEKLIASGDPVGTYLRRR